LSEPASKLEREKMIYVYGRGIPVEEAFLTSRQILRQQDLFLNSTTIFT
jgi:hypothetical protein